MIDFRKRLLVWTSRLAVVAFAFALASCSGNKGPKHRNPPSRLPSVTLPYSSSTPQHRLSSYHYPFDSNGNYVTSWAADGERRSGRSSASRADVAAWSASHTRPKPALNKPTRLNSSSSRNSSRSTANTSKRRTPPKTQPKRTPARSSSYTVRRGDTLSAIARRNRTTVAKIKAANGLRSDNIAIGKVLRIPR